MDGVREFVTKHFFIIEDANNLDTTVRRNRGLNQVFGQGRGANQQDPSLFAFNLKKSGTNHPKGNSQTGGEAHQKGHEENDYATGVTETSVEESDGKHDAHHDE
jgi:hypothetical protein